MSNFINKLLSIFMPRIICFLKILHPTLFGVLLFPEWLVTEGHSRMKSIKETENAHGVVVGCLEALQKNLLLTYLLQQVWKYPLNSHTTAGHEWRWHSTLWQALMRSQISSLIYYIELVINHSSHGMMEWSTELIRCAAHGEGPINTRYCLCCCHHCRPHPPLWY